jgi:predicted nucleic acid-binding protein
MSGANGWFSCRIGYVEVARAVQLAGYDARPVRDEWMKFDIVDVDQGLVEHAAALAVSHRLRSLDALHLASALLLPRDEVTFASWDDRLSAAAGAEGLALLPR